MDASGVLDLSDVESVDGLKVAEYIEQIIGHEGEEGKKKLTAVDLSRAGLTPGDLEHILCALSRLPVPLDNLVLDSCVMTPEAVDVLRSQSKGLSRAKTISLGNADLSRSVCAEILSQLQGSACRALSLSGVPLGTHFTPGVRGHGILANALASMQLEKLSLRACGILADDLEKVVCPLLNTCSSSLRVLNLSHNSIGDGGARHLARALRLNSSLEELDLTDCGLHCGVVELARSVSRHLHLRKLSVANNLCSHDDGNHMMEALSGSETLTTLRMEGISHFMSYDVALGKSLTITNIQAWLNLSMAKNSTFDRHVAQLVFEYASLEEFELAMFCDW